MPLLLMSLSMMGFTLGLASMLFVLIGEMIPLQIKNEVNGWMNVWNKCGETIALMLFHVMLDNMGMSGTFLFYSACCFSCVVYMKMGLHETKGESLATIERKVTATNLSDMNK